MHILKDANWKNISKEKFNIAVLPWGAAEAHNYHLPYGTDIYESEYISSESSRKANSKGAKTIVLPAIPFGVNTGQLDIPLTININPSTQLKLLYDIAYSLNHQHINKLVIINSHGGNDFKQFIREIYLKLPKIFICQINWYKIFDNKKYFDEPGDHAGEMETSIMMNIAPDIVLPLDEAGNGKEKKFKVAGLKEGWVAAQRLWREISNDTGVGNPKAASAEKGKKFLNDVTDKISQFLIELDKTSLDDLYEKD